MAFTNNPQGNTTDRVRLLVGDISTSTSGEFLSDVDYLWMISESPSIYIAASLACNTLVGAFTAAAASASGSGYIEKRVGDLQLKKADAQQLVSMYRSMANKFSRMAAGKITPTAGGLTRPDGSTVAPFFFRGLTDNPQALSPRDASTSP